MAGSALYVSGRTQDIGWGVTVALLDAKDTFEEKVELQENGEYAYLRGEEWVPVSRRNETINVKDGEPVVVEIWDTDKGPITTSPLT